MDERGGDTRSTTMQMSEVAADFYKKLVMVGDGGSGKTSMLSAYATGICPENVHATIFDTILTEVDVGSKKVRLSMWDTAGQETYDRLRTQSYADADVVVIVFAIDSPESLLSVETRWNPEVRHFCYGVPFLLVGNKKDLRDDPDTIERLREKRQAPVAYKDGLAVSKSIKAKHYIECSALNKEGIAEVFQRATLLAMGPRGENVFSKWCCIYA